MHHTVNEEVPFSVDSRKISIFGKDLIHSKGFQVFLQVNAFSSKGEFRHVKLESLHAVGGLVKELLKLRLRCRI